ncbi:MAG: hypothetical protein JOZ81_01615 [Chloroflexi bacterium]|nr:hypothetical protein [Chloroflexota bacterium]
MSPARVPPGRALACTILRVFVVAQAPSALAESAPTAQRHAVVARALFATLYVVSAVLLFASHVREFADESDNLLGGLLLVRGERLYVDYFSSHMPFAYYVAAIPAALGAVQLEHFRPFTNVLLLLTTAFLTLTFWNVLPRAVLATWAVLTVFAHALQFGEMLTAGTTAGFGCLAAGMLFYANPMLRFDWKQTLGLSAAVFVAVQSELLALYPLAVLGVVYVVRMWRHPLEMLRVAAVVAAPNAAVLLVFYLQGSLPAMVYDTVQFNQTYYSQFLMSASPAQMLHDWEAQYRTFIFNSLTDPLGIQGVLVLANLGAAALVWSRRGPLVGIAYYAFVALSHIRTEDGYYLVSYMSIALLLVWAVDCVERRRASVQTAVAVVCLLIGMNFVVRVALTYDFSREPARNAQEVPVILALTQPGDRIFVGPYDPYIYLATNRMPAATSEFFFPWQAIDPRSSEQVVSELRASRPPVIVFRRMEAVNDRWLAGEYAASLLDALSADYVTLDGMSDVLVPRDRLAEMEQRLQSVRQ